MFKGKSLCAFAAGFALAGSFLHAQGNPQRGKKVFDQCFACHNAYYPNAKVGPSLQGLYKRHQLVNGKEVSDGNVRVVIQRGGNVMPGFQMPDRDVSDLIAFLKTL